MIALTRWLQSLALRPLTISLMALGIASSGAISAAQEPLLRVTETFKVKYGSLRIDITTRITSASAVTEQGFEVQKSALPKGRHTLIIAIEDGVGRLSERQLQFEIF